jgi:hypothetical protein
MSEPRIAREPTSETPTPSATKHRTLVTAAVDRPAFALADVDGRIV